MGKLLMIQILNKKAAVHCEPQLFAVIQFLLLQKSGQN